MTSRQRYTLYRFTWSITVAMAFRWHRMYQHCKCNVIVV
jgi:hypothetical protein